MSQIMKSFLGLFLIMFMVVTSAGVLSGFLSVLSAQNTHAAIISELEDSDFAEDGTIDLITLLVKTSLVPTRSEGRRAIEQGGVSIDGEKNTDIRYAMKKEDFQGEGVILKRGKKKFNKVCLK